MFENHQDKEETAAPRPLTIVLLSGLYLFLFLLTISTYGSPLPFMGTIFEGRTAQILVFADSLVSLYLFLGLMKRQRLTWYLLMGYNVFEIINTAVNLLKITAAQVEKIAGQPVDANGLLVNNLFVVTVIILLTIFIYRQKSYFNNNSPYIF